MECWNPLESSTFFFHLERDEIGSESAIKKWINSLWNSWRGYCIEDRSSCNENLSRYREEISMEMHKIAWEIMFFYKSSSTAKGVNNPTGRFRVSGRNSPANGDHAAFHGAVWISTWIRANTGHITPRRPLVSAFTRQMNHACARKIAEFTFLTTEHVSPRGLRPREFVSRRTNERTSKTATRSILRV